MPRDLTGLMERCVGDRFWSLVYQDRYPDGGNVYTLYTASFSGKLTEVATDVAALAVGDGTVAWVTTGGEVVTETAQGGDRHRVAVPLTPGCRMPTPLQLQTEAGTGALAVSGSAIALAESCGEGKNQRLEMLAFDLSGRLLVTSPGCTASTRSSATTRWSSPACRCP